MYFLISVPNERFHLVMCMRAMQRRLGADTSISRDSPELLRTVTDSFGGRMVLVDWSRRKILADLAVPGVSGFAIDGQLIVSASWIEHCVYVWKGSERIACISHPWFNHLHSVEFTPQNTLLIPSAGSDLLLEVSLSGQALYRWFGPEHGYHAPHGDTLPVFQADADYRQMRRSTAERAMHMTCAFPAGENRFLATLFHQGELIQIEPSSGRSSVVLDGLSRPHGIHRRRGGFLVSDTLGHRIVLLDDALNADSEIPFGSQWLQDTIETSSGTYLALENVHIDQLPEPGLTNRIVEIDPKGGIVQALNIAADYRLFTVREIDAEFAQWLSGQWGATDSFSRWVWN
jgi:hypothetical protein